MDSNLAQEAINAALSGDWQKAVDLNSKILKNNPEDVDALNRIARAYAEQGNIVKAQSATKKVLKIDSQNPIALRCFAKWENYKSNGVSNKVSPDIFIENLSKVKVINLVNLGDVGNFLSLDCGDSVKIVPTMHRISVSTTDDKHIGRFPDDLASRYIKLMKSGNHFEAIIKSTDKTHVQIMIKTKS